jgi:nicotinate-nucleotide adenylyltransferase
MQTSYQRIGIFGGTFDPPHRGHMKIAAQAIQQLGLDHIYFVPAYIPPHKQHHSAATARHRWAMMKLAIGGKKEFKVSAIELRRRGISYTVDSLKAVKKKFPEAELVLIIGADNLQQFHSWKSPNTILRLASLAVYKRKGYHLVRKETSVPYQLLNGPMLQISSTDVRLNIRKGSSIRSLVPPVVARYIKKHALYKTASRSMKRQVHENHRAG